LLDDANQLDATRNGVTEAVARDVARLLSGGALAPTPAGTLEPVKPRDVAVLCRTNKQALGIQLALSQLNIPAVFQGDESVFQSEDAVEIERVLRALASPSDAGAIRTFLCSWYGGLNAHQLLELEDDDAKWDAQRARMQDLHELWLHHGFMQAMRALILDYQVEARLLARPDGTRRITNLWHLVELLAGASIHQRLGPLGLLRWYQIVRQDEARRAELVGEDHELRLESSEDAVKLTTIHKSKGLEYPVVYCPFLWESAELRPTDKEFPRFHDPDADYALTLDLGSVEKPQHVELAGQEGLAESLRLLYVALTRAKHRICIVLPNSKGLAKSALGYALFGGGEPDALKKRVGKLEPEARERHLSELCSVLSPRWSLRRLDTSTPAPRYQPRAEPARDLRARPVRRVLDRLTKVSSFSALVAERSAAHVDVAVDHDALALDDREQAAKPTSNLVLDDFPKGAAAGQLIHEVLENVDFAASRDELEQAVSQILAARAYAADLSSKLAAGLHAALRTPLDASGLTLAQVRREARLHEMEFVIPVSQTLTPRALERAFREQRAPTAHPEYASDLRDLGFDALKGLLRGFVDLVFLHEERFYVVDYKSNRLGPNAADYGQPAMVEAMREHHYFLQYHLYALALQRYLKLRVPGYEHATHFGGVYYLFLRGMSPEHPLGAGVFYDRPSESLLNALDAVFGEQP
jgi:exodeoxyribonuclease V beta subunit